MLYLRQRTLSDSNLLQAIAAKNPEEMTEQEKVLWKVEIFKQCEDTEDYLNEKIQNVEEKRLELRHLIEDAQHMVHEYNDAVERIGVKAKE